MSGREAPWLPTRRHRGETSNVTVAVVGSINQDLVLRVPRQPGPGETVLGHGHSTGPGGKGANQAVAAARLGAEVAFFGRVGVDEAGRQMIAVLEEANIDVSGVGVSDDDRTGLAVIALDDAAENAIIVSPGVNARFSPQHLEAAGEVLRRAAVTLIQLEIPMDTVTRAVELTGGQLVLNPAPAQPLSRELLSLVDVLIPNQSELALLSGRDELGLLEESAEAAMAITGPRAVVVTMGAEGALIVSERGVEHMPAPKVDAIDTTGAGDTFCGALAEALARGETLGDSVSRAVFAGAAATTRIGAQAAMPTRLELEAMMGDR